MIRFIRTTHTEAGRAIFYKKFIMLLAFPFKRIMFNDINQGGSLGDTLFPVPEFDNILDLINYLKDNSGYDYSNTFSMIDFMKGKYVAELGCGHGFISVALSSEVGQLDGFDVDAQAIDTAIHLKDKYSIKNMSPYLFDGYNTKKLDKTYDVVLSADVLEHVPEPLKYLKECYRILKDDGVIILTTPNGLIAKKNKDIIKSHSPFHITEYYPSELKNMITENKFKIYKTYRKLDVITNGYRSTKIEEFLYKISSPRLIKLASNVKRRFFKKPKLEKTCSYDNYKVFDSSLDDITKKNCDVIIIVAKK